MKPSRRDLPLLPLTPTMFEVLIALADGEKHGYAIIMVSVGAPWRTVLSAGTTRSSGASLRA
jgi:hypothetical protein